MDDILVGECMTTSASLWKIHFLKISEQAPLTFMYKRPSAKLTKIDNNCHPDIGYQGTS